jgi:hypothetical protein
MVAPMKKPLILTICLLVAGCSDADWNRALNYTGVNQAMDYAGMGGDDSASADTAQPAASAAVTTTAAAATTAAPTPAPNNDLCRAVATQDATSNDFDPTTQQRIFARSYSQCVAIYAR